MEFEVSYTLDDEQQFWDGTVHVPSCAYRGRHHHPLSPLRPGRPRDLTRECHPAGSNYYLTDKALLAELDDILSVRCKSPGLIDQALRAFLRFTSTYRGTIMPSRPSQGWCTDEGRGFLEEYLGSEFELTRCSCKLLDSSLFRDNEDYVRRQIVYGLLQVRQHASYEDSVCLS